LKALRILIVEDDKAMVMLISMTLEEMGHEVCDTECTAEGAIAAAISSRPDLIISDVKLLEGNGIDVIDRICRNGFIPHIFASGDISLVSDLRPDAVAIQKPFSYGQLLVAIDRAMTIAA